MADIVHITESDITTFESNLSTQETEYLEKLGFDTSQNCIPQSMEEPELKNKLSSIDAFAAINNAFIQAEQKGTIILSRDAITEPEIRLVSIGLDTPDQSIKKLNMILRSRTSYELETSQPRSADVSLKTTLAPEGTDIDPTSIRARMHRMEYETASLALKEGKNYRATLRNRFNTLAKENGGLPLAIYHLNPDDLRVKTIGITTRVCNHLLVYVEETDCFTLFENAYDVFRSLTPLASQAGKDRIEFECEAKAIIPRHGKTLSSEEAERTLTLAMNTAQEIVGNANTKTAIFDTSKLQQAEEQTAKYLQQKFNLKTINDGICMALNTDIEPKQLFAGEYTAKINEHIKTMPTPDEIAESLYKLPPFDINTFAQAFKAPPEPM